MQGRVPRAGELMIESRPASEVDELMARFDEFRLVADGASRTIRDIGNNAVLARLKPTVFLHGSQAPIVLPGSEVIRMECARILWGAVERGGLDVAIQGTGRCGYISARVAPPPIEVVVKAAHIGSPKHLYEGLHLVTTRHGGNILPGSRHDPYVRFDWRNPLPARDECLPTWLADQFIDVEAATDTALRCFGVLAAFLTGKGIELLDMCLFLTTDGKTIFGEISPDCIRFTLGDVEEAGRAAGPTDVSAKVARWEEFHHRIGR